MTEYEKMVKGLIYNPGDEEILSEQLQYQDKLWAMRTTKTTPIKITNFFFSLSPVFSAC